MASRQHDDFLDRERRDLVSLADGVLEGRRRAAAEARVEASPALRRSLGHQRRAVAALHAVDATLPAPLRARIEAEARASGGSRLASLAWAGAAVAAAAVVAAVIVLAGGAGAPTVEEAAGLASLPATEPAPEPRRAQPALLAAEREGLAFPDWKGEFGWRASGERADELGDRETTTVFYDKEGGRIAYTIVSGEPLERAQQASTTTVEGVEFATTTEGERTVVSWLRDRHTCVLSGEGVPRETLVELAAWKGDGAVAF